MILIDASGSVEETFDREKEFAAEIINQLPISPKNAHVALIKFAAKEKVRTVWSFNRPQEQQKVLEALLNIPFTSGTTAIHTALLQVSYQLISNSYLDRAFVHFTDLLLIGSERIFIS